MSEPKKTVSLKDLINTDAEFYDAVVTLTNFVGGPGKIKEFAAKVKAGKVPAVVKALL